MDASVKKNDSKENKTQHTMSNKAQAHTPPSSDIIQINKVTKYYDTFKALDNISLSIKSKTIVAILGSNGAGKSTTIKLLCGLLKPTEGFITIDNKSYAKNANAIKQLIGYVPEESALYEDIGVLEYLEFFAALYKIPSLVAKERIEKGLKQLDLPIENKLISQLSKGMKRKVLIVRSLLHDPKILIYDEPASGLDPQTSAFILTFMQQLSARGKTIIFSSHNLSHVQKIAQRVIIIHKGKVASDTTVQELTKTQEQTFVVSYSDSTDIHKETCSLSQLKVLIARADIDILEITTQQISLEDAFFSIVKK